MGFALFLRISTFRGRARAVPRRGFPYPPLVELGLVGNCVAADTEGLYVGQAWQGVAVARGRVASGRAESCKCTGFREPVIPPLAPQRSEVIFLTHIKIKVHSSCEIKYFVETHIFKLCVILRSRVLLCVSSSRIFLGRRLPLEL